jgi:hypothetical protein
MHLKRKRPIGITLLAFVFLWIGCLGTLFFPFFLFSGLTSVLWKQLTAGVDQSVSALRLFVQFGVYAFSLILFLLYFAYACIGFGLWKLRNWARQAVLGLLLFLFVLSLVIPPIFIRPAAFAISMIIGWVFPSAWLVWYLQRPRVRWAFAVEAQIEANSLNSEPPEGMSLGAKIWTGAAILGTFFLFMCSLTFTVESMFRRSEIYRITLAEARDSACIATKVGTPFESGWMITGNFEESSAKGNAYLEIPIHGSKGKGELVASGEKQSGTWKVTKLLLVQDGQEFPLSSSAPNGGCL